LAWDQFWGSQGDLEQTKPLPRSGVGCMVEVAQGRLHQDPALLITSPLYHAHFLEGPKIQEE
jgi:hypothetical protein